MSEAGCSMGRSHGLSVTNWIKTFHSLRIPRNEMMAPRDFLGWEERHRYSVDVIP